MSSFLKRHLWAVAFGVLMLQTPFASNSWEFWAWGFGIVTLVNVKAWEHENGDS